MKKKIGLLVTMVMTLSAVTASGGGFTKTSTAKAATLSEYQQRFSTLYNKIHDSKNGYFSPLGIPYHSVETLMVEAPDYGHETTSEAMSYYTWIEAMNGRFTGNWNGLTKAWDTMEKYMIPTHDDQPTNSTYDPNKPATYAGEYETPDKYPSQLQPSVPVGKDPIANELKAAYGTSDIYGMHWLLDTDNWYGYGTRADGKTAPSYINTFQRGKQESVWETVPQPSWDEMKFGGKNGYLDLFTGDSSYSKQWKYTNAPDADARVVQAMYSADNWAKEQGVDLSSLVQKSSKMGDYLRYSFFDKYFKKIGSQDINSAATGYDSSSYLMSWYYAWGGGVGSNWSWRIGSSHDHFGYQNPLAAWVLSTNSDFKPKSTNGATDWGKSLNRQLEFYQWLQSSEGAIAGGATNSYNGRYEKYPAGTSTFYGMAYVPNPVYEDPGSNTWFGMQTWSMQRMAEYYYNTGDTKAKALLDKWVKWVKPEVKLNVDGTFQVPSTIDWSGQPDTWNGSYTGNPNLHVKIVNYSTDLGVSASLANTLLYYSAATQKYTPTAFDDKAKDIAKQLLDRMWKLYSDDKGLSAPEARNDYNRMFDQEVYIPSTFSGTMPNGDAIKPGIKFIDIRSKYKNDPDYAKVKAAYDKGESPVFNYHRFWAECEIAIANGTYANLFDNATVPTNTVKTAITTPTEGQIFDNSTTANPITISASATTDNGTIAKVEFFANGTKVGESATSPYKVTWTPSGYANSSDGVDSYALTAQATDTSGLSSVSSKVNIKVKLPVKPKPVGNVSLQFFNGNTSTSTNSIVPKFKVTNTGTTSINLADLKFRYYFTADGATSNNFWCDWASVGSSNVTGSFVKLATPVTNADTYLEVGFSTAAGTLAPGATVEIAGRFAKADWSNYSQSNDYSFNGSASSYADNSKVTAYIGGTLASGVEPK
ncbi:exoglucanase [Clostridium manihotivorum]|uniref:Exoglucanase n=1 Tax=Clostridium manihotivorum TaxID=2320868 RepID=A0A410DVE3_9CLOT|nr:glycoside hydrolase family 48 protein [Clostridium manihotivorum]QAA33059.1 exoglucanase [Clostridium manihotivorum]